MTTTTYSARITGPVPYQADGGLTHDIPLGPCLVQHTGGRSIEIIWGAQGERCAAVPAEQIRSAHAHGHLVLLD